MDNIKPTLKVPTKHGKEVDKGFDSIINEIDSSLTEDEKKEKETLFNLSKMEYLVHNDPDLSEYYHDMVEENKDLYGYHYNEAIMNIIFNTKVLKSSKYLKKYKQAPVKKKKRRDKYGVEDLKTAETKRREEKEKEKEKKETNETTSSGASGQYATAQAWSGNGQPKMSRPIWHGGAIIQESNYITDPKLFKEMLNFINENFTSINEHHLDSKEEKVAFIIQNKGDEYKDIEKLDSMSDEEIDNIYNKIEKEMGLVEETNLNEHHLETKEDRIKFIISNTGDKYGDQATLNSLNDNTIEAIYLNVEKEMGIDDEVNVDDIPDENLEEKSESKAQQKYMGMVRGVQKGELDSDDVSSDVIKTAKEMKPKDVKDFASTKHDDLPEKVEESSMLDPLPDTMGMSNDREDSMKVSKPNSTSSIQGMDNVMEELQKDIDFLNDLKENRRPSALIQLDRLKEKNQANFKSDVRKIDDIEMAKDQYTDIDYEDSKNLGQEIEKEVLKKTKGESFKNVGNSTNKKGDEIPKRNQTDDEIDKIRDGMHTIAYDSKPDERFEERMKVDMGDDLYNKRQKRLEAQTDEPMYNKDTQPVSNGDNKKQYNKYMKNIKESLISGKYKNDFNKTVFVNFELGKAKIVESVDLDSFKPINIEGMGNFRTNKFEVNESAVTTLKNKSFFINEETKEIVSMEKSKQKLITESKEVTQKKREDYEKIKKLFNYNPSSYIDTTVSKSSIK